MNHCPLDGGPIPCRYAPCQFTHHCKEGQNMNDFRTPYNYDGLEWSNQFGLACPEKTLAQQQFRDECNINILYARYLETGEMPQVLEGLTYGNFEGIFDFQTAQNAVRTAEGLFLQLPARLKNRFDNDPQKLLQFLADETNREEAEFLGLVNKEPNNGRNAQEVPPGATQDHKGAPGATPDPQPTTAPQGAKPKAPGAV